MLPRCVYSPTNTFIRHITHSVCLSTMKSSISMWRLFQPDRDAVVCRVVCINVRIDKDVAMPLDEQHTRHPTVDALYAWPSTRVLPMGVRRANHVYTRHRGRCSTRTAAICLTGTGSGALAVLRYVTDIVAISQCMDSGRVPAGSAIVRPDAPSSSRMRLRPAGSRSNIDYLNRQRTKQWRGSTTSIR